jgi:CheY-like chemotaxis protein
LRTQTLREILASILRHYGYEVLEAETGRQALEKTLSAKPNLILLDLNLPDIPGIDAAKAIKANAMTSHIPIIGCSAWSMGESKEEALRVGMVDYLPKPIPSAVIKASVEKFILP